MGVVRRAAAALRVPDLQPSGPRLRISKPCSPHPRCGSRVWCCRRPRCGGRRVRARGSARRPEDVVGLERARRFGRGRNRRAQLVRAAEGELRSRRCRTRGGPGPCGGRMAVVRVRDGRFVRRPDGSAFAVSAPQPGALPAELALALSHASRDAARRSGLSRGSSRTFSRGRRKATRISRVSPRGIGTRTAAHWPRPPTCCRETLRASPVRAESARRDAFASPSR